jgi:hypothetical protein
METRAPVRSTGRSLAPDPIRSMFHESRWIKALAEEIQTEHRLRMSRPDRKKSVPRWHRRPQTAIVEELIQHRMLVSAALKRWPVL